MRRPLIAFDIFTPVFGEPLVVSDERTLKAAIHKLDEVELYELAQFEGSDMKSVMLQIVQIQWTVYKTSWEKICRLI